MSAEDTSSQKIMSNEIGQISMQWMKKGVNIAVYGSIDTILIS